MNLSIDMKINWNKVRTAGLVFLCIFVASWNIVLQHQKYYWEKHAEEYRLDALYYEVKYDNVYQRNVELQNYIINNCKNYGK